VNAPTPAPAAIAQARIVQNWIPSLSAADPVELAKLIPEMLAAFRVAALSRLRAPTPPAMVLVGDREEVLR